MRRAVPAGATGSWRCTSPGERNLGSAPDRPVSWWAPGTALATVLARCLDGTVEERSAEPRGRRRRQAGRYDGPADGAARPGDVPVSALLARRQGHQRLDRPQGCVILGSVRLRGCTFTGSTRRSRPGRAQAVVRRLRAYGTLHMVAGDPVTGRLVRFGWVCAGGWACPGAESRRSFFTRCSGRRAGSGGQTEKTR